MFLRCADALALGLMICVALVILCWVDVFVSVWCFCVVFVILCCVYVFAFGLIICVAFVILRWVDVLCRGCYFVLC